MITDHFPCVRFIDKYPQLSQINSVIIRQKEYQKLLKSPPPIIIDFELYSEHIWTQLDKIGSVSDLRNSKIIRVKVSYQLARRKAEER